MKNIHLRLIPLAVGLLGFTVVFILYGVFFTSQGTAYVTRKALEKYFSSADFKIERVQGALTQRFSYQNIEIFNLKGFPPGTTVKIQKLSFVLTSLKPEGINLFVDNGRLKLPLSDPIVINGTLKGGVLNFNLFSKSLDVKEILSLIPDAPRLKYYSGIIDNIDWYIQGNFDEPRLNGNFFVQKLARDNFLLKSSSGGLSLRFRNLGSEMDWFGRVRLDDGTVSSKNTTISLRPSQFLFNGPFSRLTFDAHGDSTVGKVSMSIGLKGSMSKPELSLKSDPPLPEAQLLVLLATGKSWKATERALSQGQLSTDAASDFIDYFVLGGEGAKLAEKFGISDFSLKYDKQTQGIGIKKDVFDNLGVGYGVEQSHPEPGKTTVTQSLEGEYNLTNKVSIDVEKQIKQEYEARNLAGESAGPQDDNKIILKYKTKF